LRSSTDTRGQATPNFVKIRGYQINDQAFAENSEGSKTSKSAKPDDFRFFTNAGTRSARKLAAHYQMLNRPHQLHSGLSQG
jgi:hypothetical protein